MTEMQLTPIEISFEGRTDQIHGYVVPETNDVMAIDYRAPEWAITHLPTGRRIRKEPYTNAPTMARAVGIAQRFYRYSRSLNLPIDGNDAEAFKAAFLALPKLAVDTFLDEVCGS